MQTTQTRIDPRPQFATALSTATDVVARVRPDQWSLPTPCEELDVFALVQHLLGVVDRITSVGLQTDPFAVPVREVSMAQWSHACAALWAVWGDDATLDVPSPLPWAPGDGTVALVHYVTELTVHTWDLARAIDAAVDWDDDVLAMVAGRMTDYLPADGRAAVFAPMKEGLPFTPPDPYVDAVPVTGDVPLIDRIAAWYGRQP